MILKEV